MKASELIRQLQEIIATEGDLDVHSFTADGYEYESDEDVIDPPIAREFAWMEFDYGARKYDHFKKRVIYLAAQ